MGADDSFCGIGYETSSLCYRKLSVATRRGSLASRCLNLEDSRRANAVRMAAAKSGFGLECNQDFIEEPLLSPFPSRVAADYERNRQSLRVPAPPGILRVGLGVYSKWDGGSIQPRTRLSASTTSPAPPAALGRCAVKTPSVKLRIHPKTGATGEPRGREAWEEQGISTSNATHRTHGLPPARCAVAK